MPDQHFGVPSKRKGGHLHRVMHEGWRGGDQKRVAGEDSATVADGGPKRVEGKKRLRQSGKHAARSNKR
jgi:hypothetical protein